MDGFDKGKERKKVVCLLVGRERGRERLSKMHGLARRRELQIERNGSSPTLISIAKQSRAAWWEACFIIPPS
jgi:hypothetical protein